MVAPISYVVGKMFISLVIHLFIGIVVFYDDHTLEQLFHGNRTVTLFCPLLYYMDCK